jgi:hypothetical protein
MARLPRFPPNIYACAAPALKFRAIGLPNERPLAANAMSRHHRCFVSRQLRDSPRFRRSAPHRDLHWSYLRGLGAQFREDLGPLSGRAGDERTRPRSAGRKVNALSVHLCKRPGAGIRPHGRHRERFSEARRRGFRSARGCKDRPHLHWSCGCNPRRRLGQSFPAHWSRGSCRAFQRDTWPARQGDC